MSRKNRLNRGDRHGSFEVGGYRQSNGHTQQRRPGDGPVVVSPHPQRPPADNDVFASIASLGQRIEDLKQRWDATQQRIEQLRASSNEMLKQQAIQPQQPGAIDESASSPPVELLDEQA